MTKQNTNKPPMWFWIVNILALLWNLMGVLAYLGQAYMTEESKADLTAEQLGLMESTPAWVTAVFAIAVWGGLLGCIALILRKRWAKPVLLLSFVAIVIQMGHSFFMTNASEVYGTVQGVVVPLFVILIGGALVQYSRFSIKKAWLR
ncbi:hypothetical protein [Eudoraea chungangensis]|uniref:hypothetical protein n=1 Tax=Eudoraea chungangensis TaxID=1481905 RepID=UPI0023EC88EA|nr:hypothetical protein [Eudoraea chungangensis]